MTKRRLLIAVVVLMAFVTAGNAYLAIQATNRLGNVVSHELENRVKNVRHWCSGINDTRDLMRVVLQRYHVPVSVADLNCAALVAKTRASAAGL